MDPRENTPLKDLGNNGKAAISAISNRNKSLIESTDTVSLHKIQPFDLSEVIVVVTLAGYVYEWDTVNGVCVYGSFSWTVSGLN